mmetsp:Transcript_32313/g.64454  ORF Transcript_32313/g.64454 Transcript_32313/m.64454 type:complete len:203 (+) Transcript_32313:139-747(+)
MACAPNLRPAAGRTLQRSSGKRAWKRRGLALTRSSQIRTPRSRSKVRSSRKSHARSSTCRTCGTKKTREVAANPCRRPRWLRLQHKLAGGLRSAALRPAGWAPLRRLLAPPPQRLRPRRQTCWAVLDHRLLSAWAPLRVAPHQSICSAACPTSAQRRRPWPRPRRLRPHQSTFSAGLEGLQVPLHQRRGHQECQEGFLRPRR